MMSSQKDLQMKLHHLPNSYSTWVGVIKQMMKSHLIWELDGQLNPLRRVLEIISSTMTKMSLLII